MGQFRSQPLTQKLSETSASPQLEFSVTAMCGWRITMEDSHIARISINETCSLFAVFDGHGGVEVAKYASKYFVQTLVSSQSFKNKEYTKSLKDTYLSLDRMMRTPEGEKELKLIKKESRSKESGECEMEESYAGSAALVCLVTDDYIYVANAGDSRCIVSSHGVCEPMSTQIRPEDEGEMTRIKNAGGDVIEGRVNGLINVCRTLGDFQYKSNPQKSWDEQLIICTPGISKRTLEEVNYIILGSYGVFQQQHANRDILEMVMKHRKEKSLREVGEIIVDSLTASSSQSQYGMDNMTLIIVQIK